MFTGETSLNRGNRSISRRAPQGRVLSDEPLCQLGVAALQRLDDAHVIGNRT
jgi:hypothetical protein